jgi:putative SOS response-associated peptidase YedK
MCGRVIQNTPLGEIRVLFETMNAVPNSAPNYNGAPIQQSPVVRLDEKRHRSLRE